MNETLLQAGSEAFITYFMAVAPLAIVVCICVVVVKFFLKFIRG